MGVGLTHDRQANAVLKPIIVYALVTFMVDLSPSSFARLRSLGYFIASRSISRRYYRRLLGRNCTRLNWIRRAFCRRLNSDSKHSRRSAVIGSLTLPEEHLNQWGGAIAFSIYLYLHVSINLTYCACSQQRLHMRKTFIIYYIHYFGSHCKSMIV